MRLGVAERIMKSRSLVTSVRPFAAAKASCPTSFVVLSTLQCHSWNDRIVPRALSSDPSLDLSAPQEQISGLWVSIIEQLHRM